MITKCGIRVETYVHTAEGLVNFDDLTPEQKKKAATELKIRYMNAMFAGRAKFRAAEE